MENFCGSEFWNLSLTWHTEDPNLTQCFQDTILVWLPCTFLWVFLPLEIYYLRNSKAKYIPWNFLNASKLLLNSVLIILSVVDCCFSIWGSEEVYPVHYVTPIIKFLTFILAGMLLLYNRKCGLRVSGILFLFWFLLMIFGIVQFRNEIREEINEVDDVFPTPRPHLQHITYLIYFPVVVFIFLLNCIADAEPKFTEHPVSENPCPEQSASFLSRVFFSWCDSLIWKGYRQPLETKHLWSLNFEDTALGIVTRFEKYWRKSVEKSDKKKNKKTQASVLPAIMKAFGGTYLFGAFLRLIQDLLIFVNPMILKSLMNYVEQKESMEDWKGYLYAVSMLVTASLQTLFLAHYSNRMYLVGLRIRTSLVTAIYRKALRLSSAARKESTVGEIVNLMSVDAQRLMDLTIFLNLLWSSPLQIALSLYFLWDILGVAVLSGLAVMIILIPINGFIATKAKKLQIRQMKNKDERVKLMNELLSGIKVLKLYAWESSFEQQILKIRSKEIHTLKQMAYLHASISFVWSCAPFMVSLVSFATFVLMDEENVLSPSVAFVSLTLFNIIRLPLTIFPMLITIVIQASVSIKRINKFMNGDEIDPSNVTHEECDDPLVIENGTFSWGPDEDPVLKNINLRIKEGSLVAVVGSVGSGKSSLISALLGEMHKQNGRVNSKGSIAYVPQQAWIQNASLKDNITFGKSVNQKTYRKIVDACALKPDFDMLPGGDNTEIGENGINLSGGQKQRVSLARSVYSNADVYFLDDPLSAVDSHVGKHIFENVIGPSGLLNKMTRLFVTHGITYLPDVDQIIVLRDGIITETGTFEELLEKKGAFADFLLQHLQERTEKDEVSQADLNDLKQQLENTVNDEELRHKLTRVISHLSDNLSDSGSVHEHSLSRSGSIKSQKSLERSTEKVKLSRLSSRLGSNSNIPMKGEKLIEIEKSETGSVKWPVYKHYLNSIGVSLTFLSLILSLLAQGFSIGSSIWLAKWSEEDDTNNTAKRDMYLGVYGGFGFGQALAVLGSSLTMALGTLVAAAHLHNVLLSNILRNPMSFFDTTPVGRIVNRFSKDVDVVDSTLPNNLKDWLSFFFQTLGTLVVICISTPLFAAVVIPIGIVYYIVQRFFVATSRQLKRLESISRSPIYSHFGESITGASTIRAYSVQSRFIAESESKVDFNQKCYFPTIIANRWLAVRLEMVGNLIIFFSALFGVIQSNISGSSVGLSISYALQITQILNWMVRMNTEVETNIVAVERMKEYGETPQEAPWDIPSTTPHNQWPENGEVNFKDYEVRYRDGLELVLKGITFTVKGGEKVGIVGRTGAGKSSLTLALFRIVEAAGGSIIIDGHDISKMGLHAVRSRLTIIPQDPVLFSGTLRINLDPFGKYSDEEIWRALEHAHLITFIQSLPAGLNHEVNEGGDNFSVGQRQLICLARALLRKTKVLVLDEATAAVDLETDDLIQETIRIEFKDCTVLTIAHRLNTIMDSDRVLVLDKGKIAEYDTPDALLKNNNSIFYGMARDAGLV